VRLSVLTPSFNYGRFLADAMASVSDQTHPAVEGVEHVIVDGGSTDETLDLLRRAPASVVWRSEPDEGQSDALQKAFALSRGDWIGWLNADEFYLPGAFQAVAEFVERHPDVALVHGDTVFVDEHGAFLRLQAHHDFRPRVLRWHSPYISSCSMFLRRDAVPARGWDRELRAVMDWDLYLEMWSRGAAFGYLPRPLGAFRLHAGQVSATRVTESSPERQLLVARHHLPRPPMTRVFARAGQLERGLAKAVGGGFGRQRRAARFTGADMRWFDSTAALARTRALIEVASRRRGARAEAPL
jgi:glycosyltransferase involved in cell wall biosynthesis